MISVFEGKNKKYYIIYANNDCVQGILKSFSKTSAEIGSKAYGVNTGLDLKAYIGKNVRVWIDCEGRLAMLDEKQINYDVLGFILAAGSETSGLSSTAMLKILTEDGKIKSYDVSEKVVVDGKRSAVIGGASTQITPENLKDVLTAHASLSGNKDSNASQLIRYKVNSDDIITSIDTAYYNPDAESDESLQLSNLVTSGRLYCRNGGILYNLDTERTLCNVSNDAKVFIVPATVDNRINDEDIPTVKQRFFFELDTYYLSSDANYAGFECYNNNDTQTSSTVVLYAKDGTSSTGAVPGNYRNRIVAVSDVCKALNENGDSTFKITGYLSGANVKYYVTDSVTKRYQDSFTTEFQKGDVIAIETENGKISNLKRLFRYSKDAPFATIAHNGDYDSESGSVYTHRDASFYGNLYSCDGKYLSLDIRKNASPDLLSFYIGDKNLPILIYDTKKETYRAASADELIGSAQTGTISNNVYIYTNWSKAYLIIIYE